MWKNVLCVLALLQLLHGPLASQEAHSSIARIRELAAELEANLKQQEGLIGKLEENNGELSAELNEALTLLRESEESLRRQIALSENLGNLIGDQAAYFQKLQRSLTFWRVTSGLLAASLAASLIIRAAR